MAEDSKREIVDRLKQEGQLTRNSGTNSISAVRKDLVKFDNIFQSINSNIVEQTQILRETLQLHLEQTGKAERARQIAEAQRSAVPTGTSGQPSTRTRASENQEDRAGGFLSGLSALFGGGLGGFGGAAAAGSLALLRSSLRKGLMIAVAPAVGNLVGGLTQAALLEMGADTNLASEFGQAANFAGLAGMIGLAFGRRLGLVGVGAGIAASFGDDVLDAMGLDKDSMISLFGQEMRLETAAQGLMGAIGASITGVMVSPSFRKSLTSFFKDTAAEDGKIKSNLSRRRALIGATLGSAVLAGYLAYGDELKNLIEEQEFSDSAKDALKTSVDVAAIGATVALIAPGLLSLTGKLLVTALTGPVGLAVLTGAALAASVGLIENWMEQRRNKFLEELEQATKEGLANVDRIESGDSPNIFRRLQLFFGSQAQTPGEELASVIQQIERTGRLSESDVMAGMGETTPRTLTPEQTEKTQTILKNILNIPENEDISSFDFSQIDLSNLSTDLLDDIRRASEMIGLDGLITKLDSTTNIVERTAEIQNRINGLNAEKQAIEESSSTSGVPLSQSQFDRITQIESEISELNQHLSEIKGYSEGTRGFKDFGRGSFAVLHGREAVVPETTPAGQFLKNYFDENWQPVMGKLNEVSSAAISKLGASVTYAPVTMAPVTNNITSVGGSSSTSVFSTGGGRSDLDAIARPGGVQ